jgi:6-phospho-3-hexuloisomerase
LDELQTIVREIEGVIDKIDRNEMTVVSGLIRKESRIFVSGEGRSGLVAKGFAMRLMHLGYTSYVVGETITPSLKKDDVFIAVSGSGSSAHVVVDTQKALEKGSTIIAVTSKKESKVASMANVILTVPGTVKGDQGASRGSVQLLSSLFDQSLHIVLDALCLMISRRDHVQNDSALKLHW